MTWTDLRATRIEVVVTAWVDDDDEAGLDLVEYPQTFTVEQLWPEGAPEVVDARAVQERLHAKAFVRVQTPSREWQPQDALPGIPAPSPWVLTTVAL